MKTNVEITPEDIVDDLHKDKEIFEFMKQMEEHCGSMDLVMLLANHVIPLIIHDEPTMAKTMLMDWLLETDEREKLLREKKQ